MSLLNVDSNEFTLESKKTGGPGEDAVFPSSEGFRYIDNIVYCKDAFVREAKGSGNPYMIMYLNDSRGRTKTFFYFGIEEENREQMVATAINMRAKFLEISGEVELDSRGGLRNTVYQVKIYQGTRDFKKFLGTVENGEGYEKIINKLGESIGFKTPTEWVTSVSHIINDERYGAFSEYAYLSLLSSGKIVVGCLQDEDTEAKMKSSMLVAMKIIFARGEMKDNGAFLAVDLFRAMDEMVQMETQNYGLEEYHTDILDAVMAIAAGMEPETVVGTSMKLFHEYYVKTRELSNLVGTVQEGNPMPTSFNLIKRG